VVNTTKTITCKKCGLPIDLCACVEEEEDKIRKSKRKSIREGGKYKSRGKEKRREP